MVDNKNTKDIKNLLEKIKKIKSEKDTGNDLSKDQIDELVNELDEDLKHNAFARFLLTTDFNDDDKDKPLNDESVWRKSTVYYFLPKQYKTDKDKDGNCVAVVGHCSKTVNMYAKAGWTKQKGCIDIYPYSPNGKEEYYVVIMSGIGVRLPFLFKSLNDIYTSNIYFWFIHDALLHSRSGKQLMRAYIGTLKGMRKSQDRKIKQIARQLKRRQKAEKA